MPWKKRNTNKSDFYDYDSNLSSTNYFWIFVRRPRTRASLFRHSKWKKMAKKEKVDAIKSEQLLPVALNGIIDVNGEMRRGAFINGKWFCIKAGIPKSIICICSWIPRSSFASFRTVFYAHTYTHSSPPTGYIWPHHHKISCHLFDASFLHGRWPHNSR